MTDTISVRINLVFIFLETSSYKTAAIMRISHLLLPDFSNCYKMGTPATSLPGLGAAGNAPEFP